MNEFEEKDIIESQEEKLKEYEKKRKNDRRDKIVLIIIIIILLLLWLLSHRIGKIGYKEVYNPGEDRIIEIISDNDKTKNKIKDEEPINLIQVSQGDLLVTKDTRLDIFNNEKFNGEKIIAPRSNGIYKFCVENIAEQDITYDIRFTDSMSNPINMKYKLKLDNVYIRGNKDSYVNMDDLTTNDIIVLKDSNNIYTLEWIWEDDDVRDTYGGSLKTDEYYTLNLSIQASKLEK